MTKRTITITGRTKQDSTVVSMDIKVSVNFKGLAKSEIEDRLKKMNNDALDYARKWFDYAEIKMK